MRSISLVAIALLAIAVLFAGCSKTDTPDQAAVTGGSETITEAEFGVPVYPGATVTKDLETPTGLPEGIQRNVISTPDDLDKVIEFYKANLKDVTDSRVHEMDGGKMGMFTIKGSPTSTINVNITSDKEKNLTNIEVVKQEAQ